MDPHLIQTLTEASQKTGQQQQTSIVVPETIKIQPFRGLDGDDVVEWFEVFQNRLKRRLIALDSEGELTELVPDQQRSFIAICPPRRKQHSKM